MLNESEFATMLQELRDQIKENKVTVYRILYDLKEKDVTPVMATRFVHELSAKTLGEAKTYVSQHPAWEKHYEESKVIKKELAESIAGVME